MSVFLFRLFFLILGEEQVQCDRKDEHDGDAVFGEDGLDGLRENLEHLGGRGKTEAHAERHADDNHVALRESALGNHAEACEEDGAEHHDGAAAENGLRDCCEERTDRREDAAENHDASACRNGKAVHDAGERCKPDVLAKGCNRRAAEDAGDGTDKAIAADGAAHFGLVDLTLEGAAAKGAGIADGFRGGNQVNCDNGENGAEVEFRSERENLREGDDAAIRKSGEVDHAHAEREDVTDDEADQNGERTQESLRKNLSEQAGEERDASDNPVLGGTEVCSTLAASE